MTRAERGPRVAWTIWAGVIAVTSSTIGGAWDVSWHRSIGRDSFLTPAHLMIYACGVIAALICGYLIFYTTFGGSQKLKAESVSVLGFRAPLGAFIAAWGGIAMLTSAAVRNNWWHNAYGLDVKIISPPHALLILGIRGVSVGVMFLILASMNRLEAERMETGLTTSAESNYKMLQALFLYMGGLAVMGQMFFIQENTWDVMLHSTAAYISLAIAVPIAFAAISRASGNRWSCTIVASIYTVFLIGEILILPLFPASPKLGPVFNQVTHLALNEAEIPGTDHDLFRQIVLDLLWQRIKSWKAWQIALVSGVVFVAVIVAVEWPFASFLMSKAAANRFFGTIYFDYNSRPNGFDRLRRFFEPVSGMRLFMGMVWASVAATIGTWFGLLFGNWMRGVER